MYILKHMKYSSHMTDTQNLMNYPDEYDDFIFCCYDDVEINDYNNVYVDTEDEEMLCYCSIHATASMTKATELDKQK